MNHEELMAEAERLSKRCQAILAGRTAQDKSEGGT